MRRFKLAILAGCLAALGAIAATVWVGVVVREDTVVAHPYEDGLRQDAERHARAALGLAVSIPAVPEAGESPLAFELHDRGGTPVDDATVSVEVSRPATSRGERSAAGRSIGGGRWTADVAFPEAGPWDVRVDVVRGEDRVRLERRVGVRAACDLGARPCAKALEGGGEISVDVGPRPLRTMAELAVRVQVRAPPLPGPLPLAPPGGEGSHQDGRHAPTSVSALPGEGSHQDGRHAPTSVSAPPGEGSHQDGRGVPTSVSAPPGEGSHQDSRRAPTSVSPLPPAAQGGEGQGEGAVSRAVTVSFSMPGMPMGENRAKLTATAPGTYEGKAVLVRCASGRRDWIAEVELAAPGAAARTARFPLTLPEDAR